MNANKLKLQDQYKQLDKLHTQHVRERDFAKVAETFQLMMQVSDQLYGKGRDA